MEQHMNGFCRCVTALVILCCAGCQALKSETGSSRLLGRDRGETIESPVVFVGGLVEQPQAIEIPESTLSLRRAIELCGGTRSDVDSQQLLVRLSSGSLFDSGATYIPVQALNGLMGEIAVLQTDEITIVNREATALGSRYVNSALQRLADDSPEVELRWFEQARQLVAQSEVSRLGEATNLLSKTFPSNIDPKDMFVVVNRQNSTGKLDRFLIPFDDANRQADQSSVSGDTEPSGEEPANSNDTSEDAGDSAEEGGQEPLPPEEDPEMPPTEGTTETTTTQARATGSTTDDDLELPYYGPRTLDGDVIELLTANQVGFLTDRLLLRARSEIKSTLRQDSQRIHLFNNENRDSIVNSSGTFGDIVSGGKEAVSKFGQSVANFIPLPLP